ncbi:MAG: deoxyribonuclease IV [Gemmataceae bacterium]|nr:deoxyribonuclease IV [Gemmataceae bacterium]MDW8266144.1 deoxyribonuclease IV [Gemmataceae bacterium]
MPLFGAHMSIAGGYHRALLAARDHDCDTVQLFTKNSNQWAGKEITDEEVRTFRRLLKETGLKLPVAHDSYLINLASPDDALFRRSVDAFVEELQRAERLGLRYLVTHPGAHMDAGEEAGLRRVAEALDEVHQRCPGFRAQVLLETTAGQGTTLGYRFEHLASILEKVRDPDRLGVCFDTCHVFAAGYPLAPEAAYRQTLREFDRLVGLSRLKVFHLNDSAKPLGSRVDRHAHIGRGHLGLEPFRLLVNDRRFRQKPMILETPKEATADGDMDQVNLRVLRGLLRGA